MNVTERLELLMQRAADGELSADQRRELLELMEYQPDGWKRLACTFLEEQLVGHSVRQTPLVGPLIEESVVHPVQRPGGFWYHHPALTTAVTICLAFVLGVSVPWGRDVNRLQSASPVLGTDTVGIDSSPSYSDLTNDAEFLRQLADELVRRRKAGE
ncbi:MAG: hypothetical protein MK110_08785 [Fuerstiella sp.]|nr:hypothetical protein [Fuerstiella sp.]